MATERQVEANRQNAQLSTGPSTPEGKKASSRNALKHGHYSSDLALREGQWAEIAETVVAHLEEIEDTLDPQDAVQALMARNISGSTR